MKKYIFMVLIVLASSFLFSQENLETKNEIKRPILVSVGGNVQLPSNLISSMNSAVATYQGYSLFLNATFFVVPDRFALGIGAEMQFARGFPSGSQINMTFAYDPIYYFVGQFYIYHEKPFGIYTIGEIGYNLIYGTNGFSTSNETLNGGLFYSLGVGVDFAEFEAKQAKTFVYSEFKYSQNSSTLIDPSFTEYQYYGKFEIALGIKINI